jgi:succinate dehydrogenase/fumarate reductase flavoprotein subunit
MGSVLGQLGGKGRGGVRARRGRPSPTLHAVGGAGLRPAGPVAVDHRAVTAAVQRHVLPHEYNFLRHADHLGPALRSLHDTWSVVRASLGAIGEDTFRTREAAAMVAHGRWMYHAALQRVETRGMHERVDHPEQDPSQRRRLLVGGLDEIWSRPESTRRVTADGGGWAA